MTTLAKDFTFFTKNSWLRRNGLWCIVNLLCLIWALRTIGLILAQPAHTGFLYFTSSNLQYLVLTSGYSALVFLCLSLACTPAAWITGWNRIVSVRKSLGLWGFGFALLHILVFLGGTRFWVDSSQWTNVWYFIRNAWNRDTWVKFPFAWAGVLALTLLIPLALTSNRGSMRMLGKNWKRLHRLVYLAVPLAVWHYWWRELVTKEMMNGNTDFRFVYAFAAIVGVLLLIRLPPVRKAIQQTIQRRKKV